MSEPTCLGCAARDREIQRLRLRARADFSEIDDLQSDNRALRRAIHRLWKQREASREDPSCEPTNSPPTTGSGSTA